MKSFKTYKAAEEYLINRVIMTPEYINKDTHENLGEGFILDYPWENQNDRSNYEYARAFFGWLMTGEEDMSPELYEMNPWAQRFLDTTGLPENFSSSYGPKIVKQLPKVIEELRTNNDTRRAVIMILTPDDQVILGKQVTHEYPCTVAIHFLIRLERLHCIVHMRSNNIYRVMPYDVFNFTNMQMYIAIKLGISVGKYYHFINSAHIFKGDVRRLKEKAKNEK